MGLVQFKLRRFQWMKNILSIRKKRAWKLLWRGGVWRFNEGNFDVSKNTLFTFDNLYFEQFHVLPHNHLPPKFAWEDSKVLICCLGAWRRLNGERGNSFVAIKHKLSKIFSFSSGNDAQDYFQLLMFLISTQIISST